MSAAAASTLTQADHEWKPKTNPWLIAFVVSLAAFMEVLDTSIANVALPHIAGNLGASQDQSTWVLTSYLVSNAIVLPISGWLVSVFGRKRFFMTCIVIFTISSLACGIAPSLGILLVARVVQGAGGGGLQPMAQAILADTFPPRLRGLAFSLYGVTAIFAPSIGPTLGGWITDNYTWRWIFLMNLPVGIMALILVYQLVEDPPYLTRARALGTACQARLCWLLAAGPGRWRFADPARQGPGGRLVRFPLYCHLDCDCQRLPYGPGNMGALSEEPYRGCQAVWAFQFRYLQHDDVRGWRHVVCDHGAGAAVSASQHGLYSRVGGHGTFRRGLCFAGRIAIHRHAGGPLSGPLSDRSGMAAADRQHVLSTERIDLLISFSSATWLRIAQYAPLGLVFIPTTAAAYYGMPKDKNNAIAGLVNFMRNIGASVGTSVVTTVLARRDQFHQERIGSNITAASPVLHSTVNGLAEQLRQSGFSAHDALNGSLWAGLSNTAITGFHSFLHRHILASDGGRRLHVLPDVLLEKNDPRGGEKVIAH